MKILCKYCDRYLAEAKGTTILEGLICSNSKCKAKLNIKIITPSSSEAERKYKFSTSEELPKREKLDTTTC